MCTQSTCQKRAPFPNPGEDDNLFLSSISVKPACRNSAVFFALRSANNTNDNKSIITRAMKRQVEFQCEMSVVVVRMTTTNKRFYTALVMQTDDIFQSATSNFFSPFFLFSAARYGSARLLMRRQLLEGVSRDCLALMCCIDLEETAR